MFSMKAQVGMEYMLMTIVVLIAIITTFTYVYLNYSQITRINQLNTAVNTLNNTANQVYAWGPGNVFFTRIELPSGVLALQVRHVCKASPPCTQFYEISSSELVWTMDMPGNNYVAVTGVRHPVDENILMALTEGQHEMKVMWNGSWIHIEEA